MRRTPHPFFWLLLSFGVVAGIATFQTEGATPGFALESLWLYRAELFLAFFACLYALSICLWLAYHGSTFRRVELPGGMAIEPPDAGALDRAARDFEAFESRVERGFAETESSIAELRKAVDAVVRGRLA